MPDTNEVAIAIANAATHELDAALARIKHCVNQLTDENIWHRPASGQNSIANLLLHLAGNLRQWIVVGLSGGEDRRNRPLEFADNSQRPSAELIDALDAAIAEAKATLARQTPDDLMRTRLIQGFDVSGLAAIFDSIPHFRGHTQEIVFRTRLILGREYRFAWEPASE